MVNIAVVLGSTRPGRRGSAVAEWVVQYARQHPAIVEGSARISLLDIAGFALPLFDEPVPPMLAAPTHEHTKRWAAAVSRFDGFMFVTPEYNHSIPAALKNAIDYLFSEWNDKSGAAIGYGTLGAARAVEHLRTILAEVKVATVRSQVALSLFDDFRIDDPTQPGEFVPREHQQEALGRTLEEVVEWAQALAALRQRRGEGVR